MTIEDSTFESLDIDNQSGDCTMDNVEIAGNTSISNEFGNSEASNCSFNEITANMECGDLDFINCVYSANVNIEESFGDVSVEGECTTDSFGFDLDASFGDILTHHPNKNQIKKKISESLKKKNSLLTKEERNLPGKK